MKISELNMIEEINDDIILAKIVNSKGSVPRNKHVSMAISKNNEFGTIGGGELEFQVINTAKKLIKKKNNYQITLEIPLGPTLGQCCGGYVKIDLTKYNSGKELLSKNNIKNDILKNNKNLYIYGAGHVGQALISKLDGVGFNVFVIDSRQSILKKLKYDFVIPIYSKNNDILINKIPNNSYHIIMTHSHKLDLEICSMLLTKNNFSFIGLIGSKTKKARFIKRLIELGHSNEKINKIECPIGFEKIKGKEPDVIAISIIARLLVHKSSSSFQSREYLKIVAK